MWYLGPVSTSCWTAFLFEWRLVISLNAKDTTCHEASYRWGMKLVHSTALNAPTGRARRPVNVSTIKYALATELINATGMNARNSQTGMKSGSAEISFLDLCFITGPAVADWVGKFDPDCDPNGVDADSLLRHLEVRPRRPCSAIPSRAHAITMVPVMTTLNTCHQNFSTYVGSACRYHPARWIPTKHEGPESRTASSVQRSRWEICHS